MHAVAFANGHGNGHGFGIVLCNTEVSYVDCYDNVTHRLCCRILLLLLFTLLLNQGYKSCHYRSCTCSKSCITCSYRITRFYPLVSFNRRSWLGPMRMARIYPCPKSSCLHLSIQSHTHPHFPQCGPVSQTWAEE
jgi:hypothetical protein